MSFTDPFMASDNAGAAGSSENFSDDDLELGAVELKNVRLVTFIKFMLLGIDS